ncbi:hypothetical protein ACWDPV_12230 [Gordonia sp. NPDC003504]
MTHRNTPDGDKPEDNIPAGDKPAGNVPAATNPDNEITGEIPRVDAPTTDTPTGGRPAGQPHPRRRPLRDRNWKHIYRTRIRTSTAILLVAFLGCWTLYGFTSQRYAPAPTTTAPAQVARTTTPTYYSEPATTYSSTTPSVSESVSGEPSVSGTSGEEGAESAPGTDESSTTTTNKNPFQWLQPNTTNTTTTVPSR